VNALLLAARSTWSVLPESWRLVRLRWPILLLFGFVALGVGAWIHRWDPVMEEWVRAHQDHTWAVTAAQLSYWGELHLAPVFAVILLAVVGIWRRRPILRWAALAGLLGGCIGGIAANIVKVIIGRPRPSTSLIDGVNWFHLGYDYASFPSGHATHCLGLAAAVIVLAPRSGSVMIIASLAVGWSRWYLVRHYASDVWAGSCLGLAIGLILGFAARRILARHSSPVHASPGTSQ
jgi:membrane-associated phospholipid phosphatase